MRPATMLCAGTPGGQCFAIDIPECLDILAAIAAARLLGAAAAGRERLGIVRWPPEPEFWSSLEHITHDALGPDGYDTAFIAGATLGTEEAVAWALSFG